MRAASFQSSVRLRNVGLRSPFPKRLCRPGREGDPTDLAKSRGVDWRLGVECLIRKLAYVPMPKDDWELSNLYL